MENTEENYGPFAGDGRKVIPLNIEWKIKKASARRCIDANRDKVTIISASGFTALIMKMYLESQSVPHRMIRCEDYDHPWVKFYTLTRTG